MGEVAAPMQALVGVHSLACCHVAFSAPYTRLVRFIVGDPSGMSSHADCAKREQRDLAGVDVVAVTLYLMWTAHQDDPARTKWSWRLSELCPKPARRSRMIENLSERVLCTQPG